MKTILLITFSLLSTTLFARDIVGTLVLKGALKDKVFVSGAATTCRVKIEKVRNILDEEDSFGNPAYQIRTQIELTGNEKVKFNKEFILINLFKNGDQSQVEDLKYFAKDDPSITMKVTDEGRVQQVNFPFNNQNISCNF